MKRQGEAAVPGDNRARAGRLTLDALALTLFLSPPLTRAASLRIGDDYGVTLTLAPIGAAGPPMRFQPAGRGRLRRAGLRQTASLWVPGGVTLRREETRLVERIAAPAAAPLFYTLARPRLEMGWHHGVLGFRFTGAEGIALRHCDASLQEAPLVSRHSTTLQEASRLHLRFRLVLAVPMRQPLVFIEPGIPGYEPAAVVQSRATIVQRSGFHNDNLRHLFAVGAQLEVTYHAAQDFASEDLFRLEWMPDIEEPATVNVYWDAALKSYHLRTGGPPAAGERIAARGQVADQSGLAISGALVGLSHGGVQYVAVSDRQGVYEIALSDGASGPAVLWCGDARRTLHLSHQTVECEPLFCDYRAAMSRQLRAAPAAGILP